MNIARKISFFILVLIILLSCNSPRNGKKSIPGNEKKTEVARQFFSIKHSSENPYVSPGMTVHLELGKSEDSLQPDSIAIAINQKRIPAEFLADQSVNFLVPDLNPGSVNVSVSVFYNDSLREIHRLGLKVLSDIEPKLYSFKVVRTYPHDIGAYTQGFEYDNGFFYEGTGNYGESSLRKTIPETGEIQKFRNLPSDIFGEGITRINGKIFQITYRAQVGFVYDENNFNLERKIYYQIREGWGLTNNGEFILMSDGSHRIYYMDTTYFSVARKIEVFDKKGEVELLNELELIDGVLYANRYTTREIVMIDPQTGKLLGRIDMTDILDKADEHPKIDYFNGIAYDKNDNRIFVTGKYWNKVYQVEFIPK